MATVADCLEDMQKLIGRAVRVKPEVDIWGTIYKRKKKGIVHRIEVDGFFGVSVWVTLMWKSRRGYQQQVVRFPFNEVEWEISDAEDSLMVKSCRTEIADAISFYEKRLEIIETAAGFCRAYLAEDAQNLSDDMLVGYVKMGHAMEMQIILESILSLFKDKNVRRNQG